LVANSFISRFEWTKIRTFRMSARLKTLDHRLQKAPFTLHVEKRLDYSIFREPIFRRPERKKAAPCACKLGDGASTGAKPRKSRRRNFVTSRRIGPLISPQGLLPKILSHFPSIRVMGVVD
jgi:hypothetical protein